jgi:GNAT superfamily N-acetyltransferase
MGADAAGRQQPAELDSGVTVRRAVLDDVPAIVRLLADDFLGATREADPADPRYRVAFHDLDADPRQLLTVLVRAPGTDEAAAGTVIGTMQLTTIPGLSHRGALRVVVEAVRVASGERGSGLGSRYLEWALRWSRSAGARLVQLSSNERRVDARRFYERLGFVADHVGMVRDLCADDP